MNITANKAFRCFLRWWTRRRRRRRRRGWRTQKHRFFSFSSKEGKTSEKKYRCCVRDDKWILFDMQKRTDWSMLVSNQGGQRREEKKICGSLTITTERRVEHYPERKETDIQVSSKSTFMGNIDHSSESECRKHRHRCTNDDKYFSLSLSLCL